LKLEKMCNSSSRMDKATMHHDPTDWFEKNTSRVDKREMILIKKCMAV
jgi:hypothetical protein